jgi:hypothetical protein
MFKIAFFNNIYAYVMPLEWHVNNGKLCFMTNMDVENFKLNNSIFQF